ncbi:MAG: hypothetical protein ACI9D5_000736 [Candidatus Endobugula sp.]|jgi:hypothetical protein
MNIFNHVSGLFGVEELKDRKWVNTKVVDSRPPTPPINKWLKNIAAYICLGSAVMYLPLAHAQGLTNVALNKNSTQGSQYGSVSSYGPAKAVDGNYSTFNHTLNSNASNWLQIDLGGEFSIKQVLIYNRNCCGGQRVKNVTVQFLDSAGNVVDERDISGALPTSSPKSLYFGSPLHGISAVRIDNGVSDYLHLTEVEVMAVPTSTGEWRFCANQNQTCKVGAESSVRYGTGTIFNEIQQVNGSIACNDSTFGNPGGSGKYCEYKVTRLGAYPLVGRTSNSVVGLTNSGAWHSVSYQGIGFNPVMIAQMQTEDGADSATVRMKNLSNTGFQVTIEEERSQDQELGHTTEVVGYLGFPEGELSDSEGNVIGEAGRISFSQGSRTQWRQLTLLRSYTHPIIIMSINTFNDTVPTVMQINYIGDDYFWYRMAEWDYLDGAHGTESVSFIVVEAGNYTLASGEQLIAGTLFANGSFDQERFPSGAKDYIHPPTVFTQQQSMNEDVAYTTRVENVTTDGFSLRLEEQESSNGVHVTEEVGYVSVGYAALDNLWRHTTKHFSTTVSNMNVAESLFSSPPSGTVTSYSKTYTINFNQTSGSNAGLFPADFPFSRPQGSSTDNFVVQSTATISVEETGYYKFGVRSDDGFRLRFGGYVIAEQVNPRGMAETLTQPVYMEADASYSIDLRYFEKTGGAALEFYMTGAQTNEFHLVHAGLNLAADDVDPPRVVTEISSDNIFDYNVIRAGDKLIHPSAGGSYYAQFNSDGDFVLYNSNTEVWSTKTGAQDTDVWANSLHHAKQCNSAALVSRYGACDVGHELKIDGLGIYVTNDEGMVIWRPDLGDLSDTDASQGYTLKFIPGGDLGLVNNATGHVRWDTDQGYRPVRKATTALMTSVHPEAAWQKPHTPYASGTTTLDGNEIADYVVEEMKQQSILSYHSDDDRSDVLLCFNCSTSSSTKYKAELTSQGDLRIVSTNSGGSILATHWNTAIGNSFTHGGVFLAVTHKGLELYNAQNNSVIWQADSTLPDGNYMLRLAKSPQQTAPHLELWNMTTNAIVWDTDPGSNHTRRQLWHLSMPQVIKNTVSAVASAGEHLLSTGYNVAAFGWDHLESFITNSAEWEDFKDLFDDAAHLRVHDAFADLAKLEQDTIDDVESALYDVGNMMLMVYKLTNPSSLYALSQSPALKDIYDLVRHPKRLVEYVERLVDGLKEAKYKAEMVVEVLQNPSDVEGIMIGAINNAMEGGRDHLENMLLGPMQTLVPNSVVNEGSKDHGRQVQATGHADDASCDDAIDPRFCRFLSEKPGFGWDISTPEIVGNFVSANKSQYKIFNAMGEGAAKKQLNHLQVRTTLVPMTHLRDINGDGVKELVKLRMRVQTLQITAMMDFRAPTGSLAFIGPFSGHTWSFPLLAYDKDDNKISHVGKNVIYGSSMGLIGRADLQLASLQEFFGDLNTLINLENQVSTIEMGSLAGTSTASLGAAAAGAQEASGAMATMLSAASSLPQAAASFGNTTLTGISGAMFYGMGKIVTVGSEIVKSPFSKSVGITAVVSTPMRFRFDYNNMTTRRKVLLHASEILGTLLTPVILEYMGAGVELDEVTQNPLSTLSIESMIGGMFGDLLFWGISTAVDNYNNTEPSATISGYIGGSVGITMSFSRKAAASTITIGSKPTETGGLLTKTRLRVRYSFSVASDGKGAEPI